MNKPEYWKWIKDIWADPTNYQMRLVFADWLEERGCLGAAKRQREYAGWIRDATTMYRVVNYEQIYLRITTEGLVKSRLLRMKKDGTIHPLPAHSAHWHGPHVTTQYLKRQR